MNKTFTIFKHYLAPENHTNINEIIYTVPEGKSVILDISMYPVYSGNNNNINASLSVIKPNDSQLNTIAGRVIKTTINTDTTVRVDRCILESNDQLHVNIHIDMNYDALCVQLWGIIQKNPPID